ncbi:MAG: DUF4867 family protein [Clostridia bacterium]|nr:DUF4867 family protein [Clostridia bacterium]
MKLESVFDDAFRPYGRVLAGDWSELLTVLRDTTEKPHDHVIYVPSHAPLEEISAFAALRDRVYGGMPIQIGYCNGTNTALGCVEYHRDSEINLVADDMVFLVAQQQDIENNTLDTARVRAFRAPAGTAVELYATTLHYAPCDGHKGAGFRVAVVLPRGTNTERPTIVAETAEDRLLWARNKWLIAHADAAKAAQGAFVGLIGQNPDIADALD